MARPSKPVAVIQAEGKSHRTKKELAARERGEKDLLTGKTMREFASTKADKVAHTEFARVSRLLKSIGKNDDLYSNSINRYCMLHSEVESLQAQRAFFDAELYEASGHKESFETLTEYYNTLARLQKSVLDIDKQVQAKRTMMLAIEKENVLTIASALRSVPKQPDSASNPLLEVLKDDG